VTVLVTGATGFLGRHVVDALLAAGKPVRALVRQRSRSLAGRGVELVLGDVEQADDVVAAAQGVEAILHLAGFVSRDPDDATRMMRVHVDGTRNVLAAADRARVVVASSSGTIAVSREPEVMAEDRPYATELVRAWPYYLSKIYQERLALQDRRAVVLSPSLLLGPGDTRGSSTEDVLRFLRRQIPTVPPGGLSFVDVRDAAAAFVAALTRGEPGERYLLGGPNWTFATFFGRLERLSKVPAPRLKVGSELAKLGASVLERLARWRGEAPAVDRQSVEMGEHFWYVDSARAADVLGFAARDPGETLLDTIRDLRARVLSQGGALITP
jgi:dihydroflavonol-4-reductase